MKSILSATWPLFFGIVLLMMGNGLQGTLLGVRATMEGFSTATTGIIMSLYSAGYLAGSILAPKLVQNVGHIRVFAALASLASAATLTHGVLVDPVTWGLARIVTGFCFSGLYIVIESWLNDISTNESRGKILGSYLFVYYACTVLGQYMMTLAPPENIELFVLISVMISIGLLPISLSSRPAPQFDAPTPAGFREVWNASPLGVTGVFFSGIGNGIFFAMGPVFAMKSGMSVSGIANFIAVFALGGVAAQLPLGLLSDRVGRRKVIITIALMATVFTLVCYAFTANTLLLYLFVFLYGAAALSIYGICAAYTNDHLAREQFVAASAMLILISGAGALGGPFLASMAMTIFGDHAFFPVLAVIYGGICLFAIYRAVRNPALPVSEQANYVAMHPRATAVAAQMAEEEAYDDTKND